VYEIIVVDNASSDGSVEMLAAEYPTVQVIANKENRGSARANNQGFAVMRGNTRSLSTRTPF
jgi:GT2 family glycosyltransferase